MILTLSVFNSKTVTKHNTLGTYIIHTIVKTNNIFNYALKNNTSVISNKYIVLTKLKVLCFRKMFNYRCVGIRGIVHYMVILYV